MHVQGFNSLDEMYAAMDANEQAANARILPPQAELRDDTTHTRYFVKAYEDCLGFGEVPSHEALVARARSGVVDPEDREALEDEIAGFPDLRARGYLTGHVHTYYVTEWRDTHVCDVIPISEQAFSEAKATGWRAVAPDAMLALVGNQDDLVKVGKITPTLIDEIAAFQRAFIQEA